MKLSDLADRKIKLKHIAAAGMACIVLLGGSMVAIEATNQSGFCGTTCHEMDPMYTSWQHSGHKNVGCAECHEKPGLEGTIRSKAQGTQELFLHVTGQVPDPIKMENPADVNCYTCHQDKIMNTDLAAANKNPHTAKHFENGMNCLSCHSGVVHNDAKNMVLPGRDSCYTCHLDAMSKL